MDKKKRIIIISVIIFVVLFLLGLIGGSVKIREILNNNGTSGLERHIH